MDKNDFEVFAQTYNKVEAICTEIMKKLAYKPDEGKPESDYIVNTEFPEFESLIVKEDDGVVEFAWYEWDGLSEIARGTVEVPKDVFINENIDEWCESALLEHKRHLEELEKQKQAKKEQEERKLFEELKRKYGES